MEIWSVKSINRDMFGKGSNKKSRRAGYIPAVLYSRQHNFHLNLDNLEMAEIFRKSGENPIVNLKIDNNTKTAIVKEIQKHPVSGELLHIDLMPINQDEMITINVPINYKNTGIIKKNGGVIQTQKNHISVSGKPEDIPRNITVDASKFNVNQTIKVKDIEISSELSINENIENIIAAFTVSNI